MRGGNCDCTWGNVIAIGETFMMHGGLSATGTFARIEATGTMSIVELAGRPPSRSLPNAALMPELVGPESGKLLSYE